MVEKKSAAPSFDIEWLEATAGSARVIVDQAGERAADLVAAWIARQNVAAVAELAADDHAPTLARKAARRGLNVLKSRGVTVPPRVRILQPPANLEVYEAWFRPPDGAGTSAFTLGARSELGRYRLVDVIIKTGSGLVSIAGMQMSRSQLRASFDVIEKRFGSAPVPVPIGWARARIALARADNDTALVPVPLGFDTHRDLLGPVPSPIPPHPADQAMLASADPAEVLPRSAELHAEPELRGFLPEPPAMQSMLMAVSARMGAGAGEDQGGVEEKVRAVIEQATDQYFTADQRHLLAGRLRDNCIAMIFRGAATRAADALAVADVVGARESSTPPHAIPFLRAFFEKAFGLLTARMAERR